MRLNRYLASCGVGSRRKCEELIQTGRITVNEKIVTQLATVVNEHSDAVKLDGKLLRFPEKLEYVLLNKPRGYVTTVADEKQRKTVMDLLPQGKRLFPVGRLDRDSEGLLLLTNDGRLAYRLTHPKFQIDKIYWVTLDREVEPPHLDKIRTGVVLEDGVTAPCEVYPRAPERDKTHLEIVLHEGRKRQIRRVFEVLGYQVTRLQRVRLGNLSLEGLKTGQWRPLTATEIQRLRELVELEKDNGS